MSKDKDRAAFLVGRPPVKPLTFVWLMPTYIAAESDDDFADPTAFVKADRGLREDDDSFWPIALFLDEETDISVAFEDALNQENPHELPH